MCVRLSILSPTPSFLAETKHIALLVGGQMGLRNVEDFSLQYCARGADAFDWLKPYLSLQQQVADGELRLVFKRKFSYR